MKSFLVYTIIVFFCVCMVIASTQFRLPKFQFDFPAICYMGEVNLTI